MGTCDGRAQLLNVQESAARSARGGPHHRERRGYKEQVVDSVKYERKRRILADWLVEPPVSNGHPYEQQKYELTREKRRERHDGY